MTPNGDISRSNPTVTPEQRILALAEKATPGPWVRGWWSGQAESQCNCSKKGALLGKRPQTEYRGAGPFHIHESDFFPDDHRISGAAPECIEIAGNYDYEEGGIVGVDDAAYIASLDPSTVSALIGVVKAARAECSTDDDGPQPYLCRCQVCKALATLDGQTEEKR